MSKSLPQLRGLRAAVVELRQTCGACPSQWEGTTADGSYVYIRFRHGYLSAEVGHKPVYGRSLSDGLDGFMTTDEMKDRLAYVLHFEESA